MYIFFKNTSSNFEIDLVHPLGRNYSDIKSSSFEAMQKRFSFKTQSKTFRAKHVVNIHS
jgi:hypothetical protein